MKPLRLTSAMVALLAFSVATPLASAYAASDTTTSKQKTGDGDTGAGDRPTPFAKQKTGDGDTGYGDRATNITKQKTGDGDTGAGDRPGVFGSTTKKP